MPQHKSVSGKSAGAFAVVVGVLVAILPIIYLGPGAVASGPVGFAVLMMEIIMGAVGFAIIGAGGYSYRTGKPRPAVAAATTIICLIIVGGIGAYIEMTGGPLIPIWVWFGAGLVAVGVSLILSFQFTSSNRSVSNDHSA